MELPGSVEQLLSWGDGGDIDAYPVERGAGGLLVSNRKTWGMNFALYNHLHNPLVDQIQRLALQMLQDLVQMLDLIVAGFNPFSQSSYSS